MTSVRTPPAASPPAPRLGAAGRSRTLVGQRARALHPLAWWGWALGLATAASRVGNPLLLLLVVAVAGYVVVARRSDAPWARAYGVYLTMGLVVIGLRVVFRALLGGGAGPDDHVLLRLPTVPTPGWLAGVEIGGPVTAEAVLGATYDGMRLAALLCCLGAANALASPRRALKVLPSALYEVGVALVVAVNVAPQLVESVHRVRRAQRLRAGSRGGRHLLRSVAMPVLHDALERSFQLAAAMDSRGYGRSAAVPAARRRTTSALLLAGLVGLCLGLYGLLSVARPGPLELGLLVAGGGLCVAGLRLGGRAVRRTTYRPDPWLAPEWLVVGSGVLAAAVVLVGAERDPLGLAAAVSPLAWPALPLLPALGMLVGVLPAFVAPRPVREVPA